MSYVYLTKQKTLGEDEDINKELNSFEEWLHKAPKLS